MQRKNKYNEFLIEISTILLALPFINKNVLILFSLLHQGFKCLKNVLKSCSSKAAK